LVLSAGVVAEVRWNPRGPVGLRLTGDGGTAFPISRDVAHRLWKPIGGSLRVSLRHELPIGQGFGMSAAGALATGLGVARVCGLPENRAIQTAHLADLFGGGGLGGVAAILGGGMEVRRRPGIPPFGTVVHRRLTKEIFWGVTGGPLPSPRLLRDERFLERLRSAASPGLARLLRHPQWNIFLEESERFTDRLRIYPPNLGRLLASIRALDCRGAQAMFGRSFFAVPPDAKSQRRLLRLLAQHSVPVHRTSLASSGAWSRLLASRGSSP
jgi:pantoate kinase